MAGRCATLRHVRPGWRDGLANEPCHATERRALSGFMVHLLPPPADGGRSLGQLRLAMGALSDACIGRLGWTIVLST